MAMPNKGRQKIVVQEETFYWAASETWRRTTTQAPIPSRAPAETHGWYYYRLHVSLMVHRATNDRSRLLATADLPNTIMGDDYPEGGVMQPRYVAALIGSALQDGWKPHNDSPFHADNLEQIICSDI